MQTTHVFRWSGEHYGFIYNGNLFDANSRYAGWVQNGTQVWGADGQFMGEIVDGSYILRNSLMVPPVPRVPHVPPVPPVPPIPPLPRLPRIPRIGFEDALA